MMCTSSDFIEDDGDLGEFSGKGSVTSMHEEFDNAIADRPGQQQPGRNTWLLADFNYIAIQFEARAVHSGLENTATSCEHFDQV